MVNRICGAENKVSCLNESIPITFKLFTPTDRFGKLRIRLMLKSSSNDILAFTEVLALSWAIFNIFPLKAKGWLQMNDNDMDMDFAIEAPTSEFKSFLSVVPGCYTKDFSQVKTSGKMGLKFGIKGVMDSLRMPATHAELKVDNASFQYPGLPASVSGINVDFKFDNPDGTPDKSIVDLKKFQANLGGEPLDAQLYLSTPISNAYAKFNKIIS